MKADEILMWAARRPRGTLAFSSIARTRAGSIEQMMELFGPKWSWKKLYRGGWRVVRVIVSEY